MFDVSTPAPTLMAGGTDLTGVYDDLGTGASFGFADLLTSQSNQILQINLNANAIAAINAASGKFAIGGSYLSQSQNQAFAFGLVDNFANVKLILDTVPTSVPQPNPLALLIIGLVGLGYFRKKKVV